jgi:hypothetical protein
MAIFLWRLAGEPSGVLGAFADVPDKAFFAEAVGWMAENEMTTGTSTTTFSPEDPVNQPPDDHVHLAAGEHRQRLGPGGGCARDRNVLGH